MMQSRYRLANRFNGIPRTLSIPHPKAYAELALCIHEHWDRLNFISRNSRSLEPRKHRDGMLVIMNYQPRHTSTVWSTRSDAWPGGRRSPRQLTIYEPLAAYTLDSIPWPLVPWLLMRIRPRRSQANAWYNDLDAAVRLTKRNETQGVPVGPATSNIISELILARVDDWSLSVTLRMSASMMTIGAAVRVLRKRTGSAGVHNLIGSRALGRQGPHRIGRR